MVCHYFAPEIGAPQARLSEMSKTWASLGHDVEVLTGMPNHPTGVIHPEFKGKARVDEERDGYRVLRTWLYATANEGVARKTLGHLSFMLTGIMQGWGKLSRPEVVVVSSPTFFSIFTAWVFSKRWRVPLVVEVRDLWPGIFVELGVLKQRQVIWVLERLELAAYSSATAVVVVSEGFKADLVRRGVPESKVSVITNGVDLDRFEPGPAIPAVRASLGAENNEVLVVYIGAHGISQGLSSVLDAARLFDPGVKLAFVGEGAQKAMLEESVAATPMNNVSFSPGVPREQVLDILRSADILLVPLRDVPLFTTFIPSKMFEFLSAEACVVGSVAGEAAQILLAAGAVVVKPEDSAQLAQAVNSLAANPDRRTLQGQLGRKYVAKHYNRDLLAKRYLKVLSRARGRK